jgi:isopenicillin-N epimerase
MNSSMPTTDTAWAEARATMLLDPTVINLNTGSFGPTPRAVFERVTELRRRLAAEPMDFLLRQAPPLLWTARERLAAFLGTVSRRLVFTANVTAAINIVAAGLRLSDPGEILMSDREYGSMQWTWERAARRAGLTVRFFSLPLMPRDSGEIVDAVAAAVTPRTRLLHFSHVLSATGLVLPAKELCDFAHRQGILTCIDGAHAPAMIPVAIDDLGCDYYGGNCHKWLLAPIGAGFLALGTNAIDRLEPFQVSWGYHYDRARADDRDNDGMTPRLKSLEFEGTRDPCAWLAVPKAIEFQDRLGRDAIRARIRHLATRTRERFDSLYGLRLSTPADPTMNGAMTAFWCPPGTDDEDLRRRLWDRRIEALVNKWPEGVMLRISTHFYTTETELERLAEYIPTLLGK